MSNFLIPLKTWFKLMFFKQGTLEYDAFRLWFWRVLSDEKLKISRKEDKLLTVYLTNLFY